MITAIKLPLYIMVESRDGLDRKKVTEVIEKFLLPDLEKTSISFGNKCKLTSSEIEQIQKLIGDFKWKLLSHEQFMTSLDNLKL